MKRVIAVLFTALVIASMFMACGKAAGAGMEIIFNNSTEPATLDPSLMTGVPEARIYMALFEGLTVYDPKTSRALPGVAEKWATSPDGMTVTFTLRKCNWSDGTPISAQTFVDSWLRTLAPETASEYAYMLNMVIKGAEEYNTGKGAAADVGIKAVNDRTFQVSLKGPAAYFVDMMSHQSFSPLPMHVIKKFGKEWTKPENIVGNGPFIMKEWKAQDSIVVVKNPKYWDAKNVKLTKVTILPIEDNNTAYNKYKNGEIDWNSGVPLDMIDEAKLRPDYQSTPQVGTYYFCYNITKKPFDNVLVRKALAMAIDKKELVEKVTKGGQVPTDSIVPPMAGYTPAPGNGFNPEEAKKLLAQAGYPNGKSWPKVTILYNTSEGHKKISEYVQQQWKKNLNIDVSLQNQEWGTFLATRSQSHDFQVARHGWIGDYLDPMTFLDMFIVGSGNNDGLFNNAKFDELVKKAALMPAGAERFQVLQEAEAIYNNQEQGGIPIYHYVNIDMIDTDKWDGWYVNPLGFHEWKFISKKAVK
jgi:oligopeptide transport system substrate-binding protein